MVNNTVVIPVAVLAAVCVVMLAFVCWWFPRAWTRGNALEHAEIDERIRQRELAEETAAGSDPDVEMAAGVREPKSSGPARVTYVPPPVTSY